MRLIACSSCHTQYDVSQILVEAFACRCGEVLSTAPLRALDTAIHRCGSCGAQLGAETANCDYCGSEIIRDPAALSLICPECFARNADDARFCGGCGVAFRPEPLRTNGHEWPCCDCGALMPSTQVAGVVLNECHTCRGLWVPGDHFDLLVSRAADTRAKTDSPVPAPRVKGANPTRQRVRYRKCPECDAFMHRKNYRKSSGVIIDVCREHGTWLDPDELEQIAGFILSGGETSSTFADEARKCSEANASLALARARIGRDFQTLGPSHPERNGQGLVEILSKIFS